MSKFHDTIRELLEEVYSFLDVSLNRELFLSTHAIDEKKELLIKLRLLQEQYPQLQLSFSDVEENREKKTSRAEPPSPSSPVPYVDMKGHFSTPDSPVVPDDEKYTACGSEKSLETEHQIYNESEDNQSTDGYKYSPVPATKVHYFEKYGFLEKKGKERFGGLLSSSLKRWCGISQGLLYYYEKPTDQAQKGVVCLEGYEARPVASKDKKVSHCFELVCPGKRTYQFSATTANEMQQWISVIERNSKIASECGKGRLNLTSPQKREVQETQEIKNFSDSEDIYEVVDEDEENNKPKTHSSTPQNAHSHHPENVTPPPRNVNQNNREVTDPIINYRELYVGLWDCPADADNELDFYRGDIIRILSKEYDSSAWWIGELNGKVGFVPKSYLMEAYEMC